VGRRALFAAILVVPPAVTVAFAACDPYEAAAPTSSEPDATVDSSPSSEAASSDARVDAPDEDAPSPPFCKTEGGVFCEDFVDPASAVLPNVAVGDGGTITVVGDPHSSAPNALRVTFPGSTDTTCRLATRTSGDLSLVVNGGFALEYKIRPATIPGRLLHGAHVETADLDGGTPCSFYFETLPNASSLVVEPYVSSTGRQLIPLSRKLVAGAWSHVVIDIGGPIGARNATVTIDGIVAASNAPFLADCASLTRIKRIGVGLFCVNSETTGDADVAFDDIRVITR
jgi:hypothetical protein